MNQMHYYRLAKSGAWTMFVASIFGALSIGISNAQIGGPGGPGASPDDPDNDNVSIIANEDAVAVEGDSGCKPFTFTVERSWRPSERVTVEYIVNVFSPSECAEPDFCSDVTGRYFYYKDSAFDGPDIGDAIPTGKSGMIGGQMATFENYSSYDKGINGIVIDVRPGIYSNSIPIAGDFGFKTGLTDDPGTWTPLNASELPQIVFLVGQGVGGGDRIELTWPSNQIKNTWLQVTLKATSNNTLDHDDVSYFGNVVGETGNDDQNAIVNLQDVALVRQNQTGFLLTDIENRYDIDRNKRVNVIDVGLARNNQSGFAPVNLISPPASSKTIVFEPNVLSEILTLDVTGDEFAELDERFEVVILSAVSDSGASIDIDESAEGMIINDDNKTADVIFVVDRSDSMGLAHEWLASDQLTGQSVLDNLDAKLHEVGFCNNRYGLVSYGSTAIGHLINDAPNLTDEERLWLSSLSIGDLEDRVLDLDTEGMFQDGIKGVRRALNLPPTTNNFQAEYKFREDAVVNIILVTDGPSKNTAELHAHQEEIKARLSGNADQQILFHVVAPVAFTADMADKYGNVPEPTDGNANMFAYLADDWVTDATSLGAAPDANGVYPPNILASVDLKDQYRRSETVPMCRIDGRPEETQVFEESWSIETWFRIDDGGSFRNAKIYYSDATDQSIVGSSNLHVDADTDIWKVYGKNGESLDFLLHPNTNWPDIQIGVDHKVELRLITPANGGPPGGFKPGRFDLFIDCEPIGSVANVHPDNFQTEFLKWIGVGCDRSQTSFDEIRLNTQEYRFTANTGGSNGIVDPVDATPFDYELYRPFKRTYLNSFGSVNGTSFGRFIMGIDLSRPIVPNPLGCLERTARDRFAYRYDGDEVSQLLLNPDHAQAKEDVDADYLIFAKSTGGTIWNLELVLETLLIAAPHCPPYDPEPELLQSFSDSFASVIADNNFEQIEE